MMQRRLLVTGGLATVGAAALPVPQRAWAQSGATALPGQPTPFSKATPGTAPPAGWKHQVLPKVKQANRFALVADKGGTVLQVSSNASASSWLAPLNVPPSQAAILRWRWKVSQSLPGSDLRSKAGDDYAARLYVTFALPLERLSGLDKLRIESARMISGTDIPAASICYVWGHAQPVGAHGPNPYTDRVHMKVLDSGAAHAGQWRERRVNLAQDWAQAFGGPMPPVNGIALSADTDNSGSNVQAWFGDVRFEA
jgi:hypothetical protein